MIAVGTTAWIIDYSFAWYLVGLNNMTKFGDWPALQITWTHLALKGMVYHGIAGLNMWLRAVTSRTQPVIGIASMLTMLATMVVYWGSLLSGAVAAR